METIIIIVGICLLLVLAYFVFGSKTNSNSNSSINNQELSSSQEYVPQSQPNHQKLPPQQHFQGGHLVLFFAEWCGACQKFKPTWYDLKQQYNGYKGVQFVEVDGDARRDLCDLHGVSGLPTVKFCPNGVENPEAILYQGDRSPQSIMQFLEQNVQ